MVIAVITGEESWTDTRALNRLFAPKVASLVIVHVVHGVHRSSTLGVILVRKLKRFLASIAVFDDPIFMREQINVDDSRLAGWDITPKSGHVLFLLSTST